MLKIVPRLFRYKGQAQHERPYVGIIAQEMPEELVPFCRFHTRLGAAAIEAFTAGGAAAPAAPAAPAAVLSQRVASPAQRVASPAQRVASPAVARAVTEEDGGEEAATGADGGNYTCRTGDKLLTLTLIPNPTPTPTPTLTLTPIQP